MDKIKALGVEIGKNDIRIREEVGYIISILKGKVHIQKNGKYIFLEPEGDAYIRLYHRPTDTEYILIYDKADELFSLYLWVGSFATDVADTYIQASFTLPKLLASEREKAIVEAQRELKRDLQKLKEKIKILEDVVSGKW